MDVSRFVDLAEDLRLGTERLVLRRMTEADVPTAIEHEQNRDIMRWVRDPCSAEEVVRRVRDTLAPWTAGDGEWLMLVLAPREDEARMLGVVCCRITAAANETVEIGYRLHPAHQRRGFCREACARLFDFLFGEVSVRKVVALCARPNEASWRLMERLGMRREGQLREYSPLGVCDVGGELPGA